MFSNFILELERQLVGPLPGIAAQLQMAGNDRKNSLPDMSGLSGYKLSAVCILLYEQNGNIYFPLIERARYDGVHSGQIALPGGSFESSDADTGQTALRELAEETGYSSKAIQLLGKLSDIYIPPSNFLVQPYVACTHELPIFRHDTSEVAELIPLALHELMDEERVKETTLEVRGYKIKTPYFDVQGRILWGATAMMLNEFKQLLKQSGFTGAYRTR